MRIGIDDFWKLPAGMETTAGHPKPLSQTQCWWIVGPSGEVLGKLTATFSDEELILLFQ